LGRLCTEEAVLGVYNQLPDYYKKIIQLKAEGCTLVHIAARYGVSEKTIREDIGAAEGGILNVIWNDISMEDFNIKLNKRLHTQRVDKLEKES
jgi:hypothetical protein